MARRQPLRGCLYKLHGRAAASEQAHVGTGMCLCHASQGGNVGPFEELCGSDCSGGKAGLARQARVTRKKGGEKLKTKASPVRRFFEVTLTPDVGVSPRWGRSDSSPISNDPH